MKRYVTLNVSGPETNRLVDSLVMAVADGGVTIVEGRCVWTDGGGVVWDEPSISISFATSESNLEPVKRTAQDWLDQGGERAVVLFATSDVTVETLEPR